MNDDLFTREEPRSRRAVLLGALGGLAAGLASVLGNPQSAAAANGGATLLGLTNTASASTTVKTTAGTGLRGESSGSGQIGVYGKATSASGSTRGVRGDVASQTGIGLLGVATATWGKAHGVQGQTASPIGAGVLGLAPGGGTAVYGSAGGTISTHASAGVYGQSEGKSVGHGVIGFTDVGTGVRAESLHGTALRVATSNGTAISSAGRLVFAEAVGIATILAGTKSIAVTTDVPLNADRTAVLATLLGSAGGAVIERAQILTATSLVIVLTKDATQNVRVAFLIVDR